MRAMPTVCIQCSLKALAEGRTVEFFDEEPEEHRLRVHPDPAATQRERVELEQRVMADPEILRKIKGE